MSMLLTARLAIPDVQVFMPSKELDSLVKPADVRAGAIQPSTVSAISKTFGLNSEEILRWIDSK
jgi:hypothetical protein